MPDAIAWVDKIAPEQAVGVCGAQSARTPSCSKRASACRRGSLSRSMRTRTGKHWDQAGLDKIVEVALGGLGPDAGHAEIAAAAQAVQAELTGRDIGADLSPMIADAYEELSSRCFEINVPTAVRSSAIGEDSGTASFAGIFDTYLGVSARPGARGGPPVLGQPVQCARGDLLAAGRRAPPGHADGRRRHRADSRPGVRRGVLRPSGHREDRPHRHRDQLGVGRGGGSGAGHAGPRGGRQGRRAHPPLPGGGQERGVELRLRRRPRGRDRHACPSGRPAGARRRADRRRGRRGAGHRTALRLPGRRGMGARPAPPGRRARLRRPGPPR